VTRRITVVGGGLAGITAALHCADAGAQVTLVEARSRLGGATFSVERDGLWIDNGQHVFLRCCTAYRSLLRRLGSEGLTTLQPRLSIPVLRPDGTRGTLRRRALPAPLHLAGAFARYPYLSPLERVGVARTALALGRLEPDDPALDLQTFGDWLARRGQGAAAMESVWDLIALPTLNVRAREASLALAVKVFRTGLVDRSDAGDLGYAAVPLARVHGDPAAEQLERAGVRVLLRARARAVERSGERLAVALAGERVDADAVVVAVPHNDLPALLPEGAVDDPAALERLGSSPIVNVHVVYDRRVTELPFAAGVGTPVQWAFDRTDPSGLERGQYLALSLSGADDYARRSLEELRDEFLPALEGLFPAATAARVETFFVTREPRATFRQSPGTGALRPPPETRIPGLLLAGAWTATGWPATMEGAVRSGTRAAVRALAPQAAPPLEVAA
jgi:squalene-associated FAD-dependent desaturase